MSEENFHFISVGSHGTFHPSGELNSTPTAIDLMFTKMRQEQCHQMVIYFHGGLVNEKSGKQTANDLEPLFRAIGAQPVFYIWETGPCETIRDNLPKILTIKLVKDLLKYILGQVAKRWGVDLPGKGAGETITFEEIEIELAKDYPFKSWDQALRTQGGAKGDIEPLTEENLTQTQVEMNLELAQMMQVRSDELEIATQEAADNTLLSDEIRQSGRDATSKGFSLLLLVQLASKVGIQVLRRHINGLDHGLYPTVVEELLRAVGLDGVGKFLWDAMKAKADEMWLPNPETLPADIRKVHVGAYFLEKLIKYAQETPGFTVDLVGHSAGSIVICNLLRTTAQRHPDFKFGRIALLAPAARMDLFYQELVTHPERFEQMRMYTMHDELELKDAIASKFYPISLVFFVSGVFEDPSATPLCGLARCLSGIKPYDESNLLHAHNYMYASEQSRLVLSVTKADALPGLRSNSEHHGDFDNVIMSNGQPGETVQSLKVFFQR